MYILYSTLLYFSQCHSDIAQSNIYIFLNFILLLQMCVLLDTTALLELGKQAFRYTCNNIC
jgi:hypothetical protein